MQKYRYRNNHRKLIDIIWPGRANKKSHRKKPEKPPEKRLFHRPVTLRKIIVYALMALAAAAIVVVCRFVFVTAIDPSAAFDAGPARPYEVKPSASESFAQATESVDPEEALKSLADLSFMDGRVNILLLGIDSTAERESTGRTDFRTDTIMMMCVDFDEGRVDILSIPRDSYADIARTKQRWKINGAYMSAGGKEGEGFECLMETVTTTLGGIPIDYYAAVEMQGLMDVIDTMGGIYFDVDYALTTESGRQIGTGYQLLDGEASLAYCRIRKGITSGTDIDRIDRQQQFMIDVFRQLKDNAKITDIPAMYSAVSDEIYTNLNLEQIAALALFMLDLDPDTELARYSLKGEYMWVYSAKYYVLDHTHTKKIVHKIFGDDVDLDIDWDYSIETVSKVAAKQALEGAIDELQEYLDGKELGKLCESYPDWEDLDDLISDAETLLANGEETLDSGNKKKMNNMADDLEDMLDDLKDFVKKAKKHPPEPTGTPDETPDETPGETPDETPEGTPGVTPSAPPSEGAPPVPADTAPTATTTT